MNKVIWLKIFNTYLSAKNKSDKKQFTLIKHKKFIKIKTRKKILIVKQYNVLN